MTKATWNGEVVAESEDVQIVEGNVYFPPDSIKKKYFHKSDTHSTCPWKGLAHYYHLEVNGKMNEDAAWYYPDTRDAAKHIKDHVAFWKGVKVE
jgi:uncharacterized protein (DUF427 family)